MGNLIFLAAYHITVRNNTTGKRQIVSNFAGNDLLAFFAAEFKRARQGKVQHPNLQHVMSVSKLDVGDRQLSGLVEVGAYGVRTTIWDTETQKVAHQRTETEADLWPFYFLVDIPTGVDEGLLILQRTGNIGIKRELQTIFVERFAEKYPDFRFSWLPSLDPKDVEAFEKGLIQKVTLVGMREPTDKFDAFETGHEEFNGHMELVIRAKRGSSLRMRKFFDGVFGGGKHSGRYALEDGGFEYNDVKAVTRVGDVRRTLQASRLGEMRSYHNITDGLKMVGGQPEYKSIHAMALAYASTIKGQIYGKKAKS